MPTKRCVKCQKDCLPVTDRDDRGNALSGGYESCYGCGVDIHYKCSIRVNTYFAREPVGYVPLENDDTLESIMEGVDNFDYFFCDRCYLAASELYLGGGFREMYKDVIRQALLELDRVEKGGKVSRLSKQMGIRNREEEIERLRESVETLREDMEEDELRITTILHDFRHSD